MKANVHWNVMRTVKPLLVIEMKGLRIVLY